MSSRRLLLAALLLSGCADLERGPAAVVPDAGTTDDATAPDGEALSFATSVLPLFDACVRCHATGQEAGDTQLLFTGGVDADLASVLRFVDTDAPAGSRLLAKLSGLGHQGGAIYAAGSPEYQTVLQWIQQGARP